MTTNCPIQYPHSHLDTHATYRGPHHAVLDDAHLARALMDDALNKHIGIGLTTDALREEVEH